MIPEIVVGIDVSKNELACSLCDRTQRPLAQRTFPNTAEGVAQIARWARPEAAWVLEPTGRYSLQAVAHGRAAGRTVLLAPPREAKQFLRSLNVRAKTDTIDSAGLALFALSRPLRPYPLRTEVHEEIAQLVKTRKSLSKALATMSQQCRSMPYSKSVLEPAMAAIRAQMRQADVRLGQLVRTSPELSSARQLARIHGVGPVTAAAVASCLSARDFTHPDQFVAFIGLDVRVVQSGGSSSNRGLTKHGDAELRRLLYCCAQSSLRSRGSPFVMQYEREREKGLSTTAALCAVARKMARVCWAIHVRKVAYDPERVYHRPPRSDVAEVVAQSDEQANVGA